jgi:hypothetical protein
LPPPDLSAVEVFHPGITDLPEDARFRPMAARRHDLKTDIRKYFPSIGRGREGIFSLF